MMMLGTDDFGWRMGNGGCDVVLMIQLVDVIRLIDTT